MNMFKHSLLEIAATWINMKTIISQNCEITILLSPRSEFKFNIKNIYIFRVNGVG